MFQVARTTHSLKNFSLGNIFFPWLLRSRVCLRVPSKVYGPATVCIWDDGWGELNQDAQDTRKCWQGELRDSGRMGFGRIRVWVDGIQTDYKAVERASLKSGFDGTDFGKIIFRGSMNFDRV